MLVNVRFKKDLIQVQVDENSSLGDLVAQIMMQTSLDNIKLIFKGMVMKDCESLLVNYGIKNGSLLMMMQEPTVSNVPKVANDSIEVPKPSPTQLAIQQLQELEKDLGSTATKFQLLENSLRNPKLTPIQKIDYQSRELSEILMKILLRIDNIQSDDAVVRTNRKDLVKRVQHELERSDELKSRVQLLKKPSL